MYHWDEGIGKCDAHLLHNFLTAKHYNPIDETWDSGFLDELKRRGYDIKTLKFSIKKL